MWVWEDRVNCRSVEEMADNIETPDDQRYPELGTTLYFSPGRASSLGI